MNSSEKIYQHFFLGDIKSLLEEKDVSLETSKQVTDHLRNTIDNVRNELGITIPISYRVGDILSFKRYFSHDDPGLFSFALFEPIINDSGNTVAGKILINPASITVFSREIDNRKFKSTPWKLISDVAHEMRHAYQYEQDTSKAIEDGNLPYEAQFCEYDANLYAFNYIKNLPGLNFIDSVEKLFFLKSLRNRLKSIQKNRKKLGLNN